ncbi:MAG: aminoacetone oxidase family FAD-binding enzyme [Epsilonproteobacteria bacterium]|nr:MAG: aminoacetone oxidase family FAD-binding enzyme [Campylobacterota bacterium]RLA63758.1 MAG: aminoacetone oxidase family FAD-binding enzyme [Campylobacterota bacterium]
MNKVTIVGAGPAGLFCAYQLLKKGYAVDLYDQSSGVGKKFLIAGDGGLNLTHSEDIEIFSTRYGKDEAFFKKLLTDFSPQDLRDWCEQLEVKTFVGTSGRVFPSNLKAAEILLNWLKVLKSYSEFNLFLKHKLVGITADKILSFAGDIKVQADTVIFALGGASWEKTGSDGKWKEFFETLGIELKPFLPMNCGFERPWSEHFIKKVDRTPLKNILIKVKNRKIRGEVMLTPFGVEGGGIYTVSNVIRDFILEQGKCFIHLDLKPDWTKEVIIQKIKSKKGKESFSNHLRKTLKVDKAMIVLLRELTDASKFENPEYLAEQIKNLKVELFGIRPISEAISTSGGVSFSGLTDDLEVKAIPGMYVVGEMLDFEAPTGGYLLQGCFSTAWRVVEAITRS